MNPLPPAPDTYSRDDEQTVRREVERAIEDLERAAAAYDVPDNASLLAGAPVRSLPLGASQTEVRECLITLINDLRSKGILR